ncbi:hypothetical protein WJX73_006138 [Symbiochloris irregularis]|uniref:DNA 3'-5' helicase n=1 Tax=Symbiochloris irregularis TaxID=706552 RepID=A0AAW1NR55_9CHLO
MAPANGAQVVQGSGSEFPPSTPPQGASASAAPVATPQLNTITSAELLSQPEHSSTSTNPSSLPPVGLVTPTPVQPERKRSAAFTSDEEAESPRTTAKRRLFDESAAELTLKELTLNKLQADAAYSPVHEPSLITAGAGSGKTTVMLQRVRHMLEQGVPPANILMVTFSRKAADDLKRRLAGVTGAEKVTALTFHSYCYRLIMRNYSCLGFTAAPTVWGSPKVTKAVTEEAIRRVTLEAARQQALEWMHASDKLDLHSTWEDILEVVRSDHPAIYARCKDAADDSLRREQERQAARQCRIAEMEAQGTPHTGKGEDPTSALVTVSDHVSVMCTLVYNALYRHYMKTEQPTPRAGEPDAKIMYQDIFKSHNAVDFDDLLSLAVQLLNTHPDVLSRERERYKMLLVDEFQDSNPAQIGLVELLQSGRGFVTAVGDSMQSIHGFRGADHRSFQLFEQAFAPPQGPSIRRPLDVNFRSTPHILAAANAAAAETQPEPVQILKACMYDKITALRDELSDRGIEFQVMKEKPFFERVIVKDAMAHLQLAVNLHDDVAFQRLLQRLPNRLGGQFLDMLRSEQAALAAQRHISHVSMYDAAVSLRKGGSMTPAMQSNLIDHLSFCESAAAECLGKSPSQALYHLLKGSGYLDWQQGGQSGEGDAYNASDDYEDEASSGDEDQSAWSKHAAQELKQADLRLHQLYGMARRFEREWHDTCTEVDAPAPNGPATLQRSAPVDQTPQQLPGDQQQRTIAEDGILQLRDFVGRCALDALDLQTSKKQQGVYIGTVHSAKGLEWDAVWVRSHGNLSAELPFHYQDPGDLPPAPTAEHPYVSNIRKRLTATREEHAAEGQRLVYVALTRAREHLFIFTMRNQQEFFWKWTWKPRCVYNRPSDFVKKIKERAPECCEVKVIRTPHEIRKRMPATWRHV